MIAINLLPKQPPALGTCECGRSKPLRGEACAVCSALDADNLSPAARSVFAEIRVAGQISPHDLEARLGSYSSRSIYRGLEELLARGYVWRRVEDVVREATPHRMFGGRVSTSRAKSRWDGGYHTVDRVVGLEAVYGLSRAA